MPETILIRNVKTVEQANNALYQIARLKEKYAALSSQHQNKINKLIEIYEKKAKVFDVGITKLEALLLKFSESNREELYLNGSKQLRLNFGVIGYRESTETVIEDEKITVERIKQMFPERAGEAIKITEKPVRNVLRKWPEEDKNLIGVRSEVKESFYYETA